MPSWFQNSVVTAKGDGASVETGTGNRVFLLSLNISEIVEQESIDSVFWIG
jgi:hypothetical protein